MSTLRFLTSNKLETGTLLNGPPVAYASGLAWTFGTTAVTRAGNFITDGVKPYALLSGALAARFPAGTRTSLVGPTTIQMTNACTAAGAGSDGGTFTPDFALEQDPDYPISNLQVPKRFVPWKTLTSPGSWSLLYDLGSSTGIGAIARLALESLEASVPAPSIDIWAGNTYGALAMIGSINGTTRDRGSLISTTARFLQFDFNSGSQWSLGGLWAGSINWDLGISYFPGSTIRNERNRRRSPSGAGLQYSQTIGPDRRVWNLAYDTLDATALARLQQIFAITRNPVLVDDADRFWEVEWADDALEWSSIFTGVNRSALRLESLR